MRIKLFILAIFLFGFQQLSAFDDDKETVIKKGMATYYANKFVGRKTTSGAVYKHDKLTAAHKTLPFGTKVTVCNLKNGKSVIVKINDRGPFGKGMMIDLSQSAAREIGILGLGVAQVEISYKLEKKN
jgi:rare lipoprotein A